MMGFNMGYSSFFFMALFWIVIVVAGIWLVSNLFPKSNSPSSSVGADNEAALEILKRRYARGELTKEEYESVRHDIER